MAQEWRFTYKPGPGFKINKDSELRTACINVTNIAFNCL
jgi:hypothetical protein